MVTLLALFLLSTAPPEFKAWPLAYIKDQNLYVSRGDGSSAHLIVQKADTPCWSPDKKKLAFSRGNAVWVVDADGKGLRQVAKLKGPYEIESLSWVKKVLWEFDDPFHNPKGQAILAEQSGSLFQLQLATSKPSFKKVTWLHGNNLDGKPSFGFPTWSHDGNRLAYVSAGDIWMATIEPQAGDMNGGLENGRLAAVAEYDLPNYRASTENYFARKLSWSSDGKWLAFEFKRIGGSGMEQVRLLDLRKSGEYWNHEHPTWIELPESAVQPCFSPSGKWIAYYRPYGDDNWNGICAVSVDGKKVVKLVKDAEQPCW